MVQCIQVAHPTHTYLAGHDYVVTHNTQQLSVGRSLYELGRNHNLRVVVVSKTGSNAAKITSSVQKYIMRSRELKQVFPDLLPDAPWKGDFFSVQRSTIAKDPSFQAIGVFGSILGSRIDLLVLDDILDFENTRTDYQRQKVIDWVFTTLLGRLTTHSRVIAVGNPWHPEDLLHVLRDRGWRSLRYPVLTLSGEPVWPAQWPLARIQAKEVELGPLEFARQMMCETRSDSDARFKRAWIKACMDRARAMNIPTMVDGFLTNREWSTYTGVDIGVSKREGAGLTVLFTIAVNDVGDRRVLDITSGRWTAPEIIENIHKIHHAYKSIVYVEDNAAQAFIAQFVAANTSIPVRPFRTGRNKLDPALGVESLAAEMANTKWIIPYAGGEEGGAHREVEEWVKEMLYYTPDAHTGDRLMASWIAREGARLGERRLKSFVFDSLRR